MADKNKINFYFLLFGIGLLINFIWEINQMPYFADKPSSTFWEGVFYCFLASIIDGLTVVLIFFIAKRLFKLKDLKLYILTAILGGITAIIFEYAANFLELWSYKEIMPIVPLIETGLLPFIQLILLIPLSIFLTNLLIKKL